MATKITSISAMRKIRQQAWQQRQQIGFVATMGNLHAGHASLLSRSKKENDISVLSIFVNPTQFNRPKDLTHYPRTPAQDQQIAQQQQVDYVFIPSEETLYPNGYDYKISENNISSRLEGKYRPGHFDGVITVVMKLLQIIKPDRAYFGKKDYQQYQLIKGLSDTFFLDTQIVGCDTIREPSGLAYSSRNTLLTPERCQFAAQFAKLLASDHTCEDIQQQLTQLGFVVEYITEYQNRRYGAVSLDGIRLIDNITLEGKQSC